MKKLKYFIIFLVFIFSDLNLALAHICNVSNPILSFGQYDPRPGASNTSTSTVTVTCSDMKADVPYTLTLYKSKFINHQIVNIKNNVTSYYSYFLIFYFISIVHNQ